MNTPLFRKLNLEAYKPGRSFLNKKKSIIKLSANESALGMSKNANKAIIKSKNNISKYPDGKFKELTSTISKKYNCKQNQIICGSGSDEIIQMLCQLFLNKGDEVVVPEYSFLMYRIYAKIVGAKVILSKEKNFKVSNDEFLKKIMNSYSIQTKEIGPNFFLLDFKRCKLNASFVEKNLEKSGIILREMNSYGIKNCLRLTIGNVRENILLIKQMKKIFKNV